MQQIASYNRLERFIYIPSGGDIINDENLILDNKHLGKTKFILESKTLKENYLVKRTKKQHYIVKRTKFIEITEGKVSYLKTQGDIHIY